MLLLFVVPLVYLVPFDYYLIYLVPLVYLVGDYEFWWNIVIYCGRLWVLMKCCELLWKIVSYCARLWVIVEYYELLWRIVCYYKELLIDYEKYLTFVNCLYPWFACNFSLFFTENNKVQKVSLLTFSVDEKILYLVQTFFKTLTVFQTLFWKRCKRSHTWCNVADD